MESKKISFGFLKTKKQDKHVIAEKREYIESVEENAIKIIGYIQFLLIKSRSRSNGRYNEGL